MPERADKPFVVGLTGGIASGKTLVSDAFAALGVPVVDTDLIARDVVEPGQPALQDIAAAFGDGVINPDGSLNRAKLRDIVFAATEKRAHLESILHPVIRDESLRRVADAEGDYVVLVVPLLFESPMKTAMDRILVVDCSEETQLERLMARDSESEADARRIMATQANREQRLSIADDVIVNDGSIDELLQSVTAMHRQYLDLSTKA